MMYAPEATKPDNEDLVDGEALLDMDVAFTAFDKDGYATFHIINKN